MANIREFENKIDAPRPDDRGAQALDKAGNAEARAGLAWGDAFSSIGREVGGTISRVGQEYVRETTAKETAEAAAKLAQAHATLTADWNEIANKTDPDKIEDAARAFGEGQVEPMLDSIGEGISTEEGQNFFTRARAEVSAGLFEKTAADVASLRGVAAVNNTLTISNQVSQTAFKDPSSFGAGVMLSHIAIDAMVESAGLPRDKAIELNAKFDHLYAKSAAMGMIQANPTAAKRDIGDGRFDKYLDATEINTLQAHAVEMEHAQTEQQKAASAEQRRAEKEQFTNNVNQVMAQTVRADGTLTVPPDFYKTAMNLRQLPGADDSTIRAVIDFGRSVTREMENGTPVFTDPHTYEDFRARAFLAPSDPRRLTSAEVIQARADGKLSDKDYNFWSKSVNELASDDARSNEQKDFSKFLASNKAYITKSSFLNVDAQGDQKYYEFSSWAQATHDQMRAAGASAADIQKRILAEIPRYQVSAAQSLEGINQRAAGSLTPLPQGPNVLKRKPGESAADFLKRSGQ